MIYDCFTFFNELDLLEIRLNILDQHVDYFVLAESYETFSGLNKSLYYLENKERFKKWNHKIIHHINGKHLATDSFQRAFFQKESIMNSLTHLSDNDVIYYGDVDEIWIPQEIDDVKIFKLHQLNYAYYLNNRSSEQWIGTFVGKYKNVKPKGLNHLRANPEYYKTNGGWHFTNMGGLEQIKRKLESYDHQEFNTSWIKDTLEQRLKEGKDFVGRSHDWQGKPFSYHIDESELPFFILESKEKYKHLFK